MEGTISSATAIRRHVLSIKEMKKNYTSEASELQVLIDSLAGSLPPPCFNILQREFKAGRGPVFSADFENIILSALRRMSAEEISRLPYIAEGLENRIKSAADISGSLDSLIEKVNTKRYTRTRIQRCLFSILTGLKNEDFMEFNLSGGPQYIRVLGFNSKGRCLLSEINKYSTLPVIIKTADFKHSCNPLLSGMLDIESASTDQYVLAYSSQENKKSGQEYTRNIVFLC